jgi:hypothetical protein
MMTSSRWQERYRWWLVQVSGSSFKVLEVARTFDAKGSNTLVYSIEGILYFVKLVPKLDLIMKLRYANHIDAMRQ